MRPTPALLCALASLVLAAQPSLPGQTQAPIKTSAKTTPKSLVKAQPEAAPAATQQLPVRQVVLYKNGVGFFEHLGSVTGNQHIAIEFTSSQLNDVLQSLTILDDNGGRIGGVNYNSTTPLAEQLKSLSLDMSDDPDSTELFNALRGQRVEVTGAPGGNLTGRLMSIESKTVHAKRGASDDDDSSEATAVPVVTRSYLTLVTTAGAVRVIELTPNLSVRPTDPALQGQLDRYLELLSSSHATGLRHLTFDTRGEGPRQLRVSYISEVPVWKSTYRLVFPKDGTDKAILQGWAVVDNTIGSDWDNVQLSLVAGAPQSFIQPLSQPLYLRRPEIPISTTAMTTPQTHEAAEDKNSSSGINTMVSIAALGEAGRDAGELRKLAPGVVSGADAIVPTDTAEISTTGEGGVVGGLISGAVRGYGPGAGGNMGGGVYRASNAFQAGDVSTGTFDDFFEYRIAQPVTIHKNESAMVPILQENLPAERVTLWSANEPTPFRAVWLENTSKLTLDRGSFSIFEAGVFAGQGLLDPIHPGEKRLLSYAVDQAIHVRLHPEESKRELRRIRIAPHGHVHLTFGVTSKNTYIAANSDDEARTVVLEVARQPGRDLSPETKPTETAANLYRFKLAVDPHKSASVLVSDEGMEYENWNITEDDSQVAQLQRLADEAPGAADKLQPILAAQQAISEMKTQLNDLAQKTAALTADEARARENLTALKGNDGAKRFVDELNRTEDAIEATRLQTVALTEKEKAAVDLLHLNLATFSLDWTQPAK